MIYTNVRGKLSWGCFASVIEHKSLLSRRVGGALLSSSCGPRSFPTSITVVKSLATGIPIVAVDTTIIITVTTITTMTITNTIIIIVLLLFLLLLSLSLILLSVSL